MRRLALVLALVLAFVLAASACKHKPPQDPASAEADRSLSLGTRLYGDKKYVDAATAFDQAYRQGHKGAALVGLARSQKALRQYAEAYETYEHALVEHESQLSSKEKREARDALKELATSIGTLAIDVSEPDAIIEVDGKPWGRSPAKARRVSVASHTVRVTKDGFSPFEQSVTIGPEARKLDVKLAASASQMSESERKATARAAYAEGAAMKDKGDCAGAIPRFEAAQRLFDAPTHLLLLAQCQAATGKLVEAHETYETLVRAKIDAQASEAFRSAQASGKGELGTLKPRIPTLRLIVLPSAPKDVALSVNGGKLPADILGIARPMNPGKYRIEIASGPKTASANVELKEAETRTVELKLP